MSVLQGPLSLIRPHIGRVRGRSVSSGVLAGVAVAAVASVSLPATGRELCAALLGAVGGIGMSAVIARRLTSRVVREAEILVAQREREAREEWLHDTVCAEIRRARLQLADPDASRGDIERVLSGLEHRVRMGQLEAAMLAGKVRVSEVVQPFLRLLQDAGVTVLDAPRFGDAGAEIDAGVAARLRHALSVLVNNAVLAGARGVSLQVRVAGECVEVEVVDDAGGFDLASVPAGRALDSLAREVGVLNLEAQSIDGRTVVRVLVPSGMAA